MLSRYDFLEDPYIHIEEDEDASDSEAEDAEYRERILKHQTRVVKRIFTDIR